MKTLNVSLTADEIQQLAVWHGDCEKRCAEMREYILAQDHKDRFRLFNGLLNSGPYLDLFKPA